MTEVRTLRAGDDAEDAVRRAAEVLSGGGLLAHPTETVYGLGGLPVDLDREVARLKGRERERPLLRLGPDVRTIRRRHPSLVWPPAARRLAAAVWPGPLTLVLDDGSEHGLGVRVEGHPLTRRVLAALEATMSSTSLNRTGAAPARTAREAEETLAGMPEARVKVAWLRAGDLAGAPPSTVLSLRGGSPRVLRRGAIEPARLERILEEEIEEEVEDG